MLVLLPPILNNVVAAVSTPDQLHINADKIQVRQSSGQVQYLGRVLVRHGALKISGDRATVTVDRGGEKSVTVWGAPVRVDFTKQDGEPIVLNCEELTYASGARQLTARDAVTLTSSEGALSAGQLDYSLTAETFSLAGTSNQPRVNASLPVTATNNAGSTAK